MVFEIEVSGDMDVLESMADRLVMVLQGALDDAMQALMAAVHDQVPIMTGNLKASHTIDEPSPLERRLYPDEVRAPYAESVILGSGPHDIYPTSARALWWPGAPHPVAVVHHPGNRPNPYLEYAAMDTDMESVVEQFISMVVSQW